MGTPARRTARSKARGNSHRVPYGYRKVPHATIKDAWTLQPDPALTDVVAHVVDLLRTSTPLLAARWLNAAGVLTQSGLVGAWSADTVMKVFTHEAMVGRVYVRGDVMRDAAGLPREVFPPLISEGQRQELIGRMRVIRRGRPDEPPRGNRRARGQGYGGGEILAQRSDRALRRVWWSDHRLCPGCGHSPVSLRPARARDVSRGASAEVDTLDAVVTDRFLRLAGSAPAGWTPATMSMARMMLAHHVERIRPPDNGLTIRAARVRPRPDCRVYVKVSRAWLACTAHRHHGVMDVEAPGSAESEPHASPAAQRPESHWTQARGPFSLTRFVLAATASFVFMVAVPYGVSKLLVWSWHGVVPVTGPNQGLLFKGGGDEIAAWSVLADGADVIIAVVLAEIGFRRLRRDLAWGIAAGPGAWFGALLTYIAVIIGKSWLAGVLS
jgi:hypothetical protein